MEAFLHDLHGLHVSKRFSEKGLISNLLTLNFELMNLKHHIGLVIAAPASGSGKTTVTLGLLAALKRRGLVVAPFKVGPDFIDPGHHARITGTTSRNLDGWMLDASANREIFSKAAQGADIAVIEGVMGLYDGYDGASDAGSTAQMAKWLGLPVLLVVDAKSMARSFAALVKGFAEFDPGLRTVGVVANNVAGERHIDYLRQAMTSIDVPLLGGIPRNAEIEIPDRHLGLFTADDHVLSDPDIYALADLVENHMDVTALLDSLPGVPIETAASANLPAPDVRIGVARDNAFCFYYEDNLDLLRQAGCEIVFFSPINDPEPPAGLHGLYLGGGYPELFADQLSENVSMRETIRDLCDSGMPVYGECGGFMYLCRYLITKEGASHEMAGVFSFETRMQPRLASLGYREIRLLSDTPIGPAGTIARGHEFHYSKWASAGESSDAAPVYGATDKSGADRGCPGWLKNSTLGSYVHLHFRSCPEIGAYFADACRRYKNEKG